MLTFERMTRHKDAYICRIKGGCGAEEWMDTHYGEYPGYVCDECPFMNVINHLAELEDYLEEMENENK